MQRELRAYLACGIHAQGFLRARCSSCRREMLVAFSCKLRGVCPSCNARRMCNTAAHLTDRVLPDVPIRQWVLSVPFELRLLLARNASAARGLRRCISAARSVRDTPPKSGGCGDGQVVLKFWEAGAELLLARPARRPAYLKWHLVTNYGPAWPVEK